MEIGQLSLYVIMWHASSTSNTAPRHPSQPLQPNSIKFDKRISFAIMFGFGLGFDGRGLGNSIGFNHPYIGPPVISCGYQCVCQATNCQIHTANLP